MQYRSTNLFQPSRSYDFTPQEERIVFVSYRRDDEQLALECVDILRSIPGLNYWFDEHDKCMAEAQGQNSDIAIANCIEHGLDVASALLGIIGPQTFKSPWIPYEIGGARGRFTDSDPSVEPPPAPHPLIVHYIYGEMEEFPAFVALGTPLRCPCEVQEWAESLSQVLRMIQGRSINQTSVAFQLISPANRRSKIPPAPRGTAKITVGRLCPLARVRGRICDVLSQRCRRCCLSGHASAGSIVSLLRARLGCSGVRDRSDRTVHDYSSPTSDPLTSCYDSKASTSPSLQED